MAISLLYNPFPMRMFEADGDFASGAKAFFYLARTTTPLVVYTDSPLAIPHPWPVVADGYGLLPPIYLATGTEYKIRIEDALGSLLYAADGIANPATPESGGGEGIVVQTAQIFQTGDMIWNASAAERVGWVRCNGRTISSATGTADTANLDCEALFAYLWNNFSDSLCAVTPGGRGANAVADWGVSKSIATLDMRGRGITGLDTMGSTAANLIQVPNAALATTTASPTVTVSTVAGLAVGMYVVATGVPADTKIIAIPTSTTITLSANATATATGVAARFSVFADAQTPGAGGGENTHTQTLSELVNHTHAVTAAAGVAYIGAPNNAASGTAFGVAGNTSIAATGGSMPMLIWTPTRVGSWYCKK